MSISCGSGKTLRCEDVTKVAILGYKVASDITPTSTDAKVVPGSDAPSSEKPEEFDLPCDPRVTKAGLFCRLSSLLQSPGLASPQFLQRITDMLNSDTIVPFVTSTDNAGDQVIAVLAGNGFCVGAAAQSTEGIVSASEAYTKAGLNASISLSISDKRLFEGNPFLLTGLGCILATAAVNFLPMVECVAALSCEAFGCSTAESLDAAAFEVGRPHRGQIQSAANLRLLLEGSKRIGKCTDDESLQLDAGQLQCAAQVIGACRDNVVAAMKTMNIELNSFSLAPTGSAGTGAAVDGIQSVLTVHTLCNTLDALCEASIRRQSAVRKSARAAKSNAGADDSDAAILPSTSLVAVSYTGGDISAAALNFMFGKIARTTECLALEAAAALKVLDDIEAAETAARLHKMQLKDASAASAASATTTTAAAAGANGEGGGANKKAAADDRNLTPEQLAKAEKKRKEKAEKAAQKAAAKEQKKGSSGLTLGAGSTQFRTFLQRKLLLSQNDCGDFEQKLKLLEQVFNPFEYQSAESSEVTAVAAAAAADCSLPVFCASLLEQLISGGKFRPKIAKGARDFGPEQMRIREQAFAAIRRVFKRHGGVEIDTPVFELKELLTGKYGEDSKLIYDLADQGGELLSLRYDLTVPFARFLAMNAVGNIKRFHIAKVYRRDQPQPARGRFREFYQCDFDVAGNFAPMVADAEVITVAVEILRGLPVGAFMIKLNHRKLLDAIFDICGVPADKFRPICSAVDKLDKMSWEEVKSEMVDEKGLAPAAADRIGEFVLNSGHPKQLWQKLTEEGKFGAHEQALAAMNEFKILFDYLDAMGSLDYVSFDLSLARGLDYYTGVIYEAVLVDGAMAVGSIAAGGRYDNLVGMFSPSGMQTPCVGVSIGVERVFAIMERKAQEKKILQSTNIQVFVASIGANLLSERMKVARMLWEANFSAEYSHQENPKFKKQLDDVLERGIGFMVVFGQDELDKGNLKLKNMAQHTEVEIPRSELVSTLIAQGCAAIPAGADVQFLELLQSESAADQSMLPPPPPPP